MSDASDDDISLTSTAPSEQVSEYEVETILTERVTDDGMLYLVKWANYPIERSTWESSDMFNNRETLVDWHKKKNAVAEGKQPAFDLKAWNTHLIGIENAKNDRRKRRAAKRRKLNQSNTDPKLFSMENPPKKLRPVTTARRRDSIDATRKPVSFSVRGQGSPPANKISDSPFESNTLPNNDRRKSAPAPPKPAPAMFASGLEPPTGPKGLLAARQKRQMSSDSSKAFSNLSTKWRYEKAKHYEPAPDISQLELVRPSEWPPRTGVNATKIGNHVVSSPAGDSNVSPSGNNDQRDADIGGSPVSRQRADALDEINEPSVPQSDSRTPILDSWRPPRRPMGDTWRPEDEPQPLPDKRNRRDMPNSYLPDTISPISPNRGRELEITIPPMPIRQPNPHSLCPSPGRFFNQGELYVHMFYGRDKKEIGSARLCGIAWGCKSKLLSQRRAKRIDVWFEHLCTPGDYSTLCDRVGYYKNKKFSNGWIEGFDDNEPEIYKMGYELKKGNIAAICQFSPESVIIAYPPKSPGFGFLDQDFGSPSNVFLNFVVRNSLGPIERFQFRGSQKQVSSRTVSRFPGRDSPDYDLGALNNSTNESNIAIKNSADNQKFQNQRETLDKRQGFTIKGISAMKEQTPHIPSAGSNISTSTPEVKERRPFTRDSMTVTQPLATCQAPLPVENQPPAANTLTLQTSLPAVPTEDPPTNQHQSSAPENFTPVETSPIFENTPTEAPSRIWTPIETPVPSEEVAGDTTAAEKPSPVNVPSAPTNLSAAQKSSDTQAPTSTSNPLSVRTSPSVMKPDFVEMSNFTEQLSQNQFDLDAFFAKMWKISFGELAMVIGPEKGLSPNFFLMFPLGNERVQDEYQMVTELLKKHNVVIYSNHLPDDWEKFRRTASRGVVLFHESFTDYHAIPCFKDAIRKPFSFWTVSLSSPLQYSRNLANFDRVFPHGGVILITEDFLVQEPDAALIILFWFQEWCKKKFPGSWKIMLRPGILDWLLEQPEPKEADRKGVWIAMYALILKLVNRNASLADDDVLDGIYDGFSETRIISPPRIPLYGSRTEDDNPDVPKGLTQEYRNTDHLIEFFGGWTIVNNHRFRRFVVLTALKPLPRWEAWNHLDFHWGAKAFMQNFSVDYRSIWKELKTPGKAGAESKSQAHAPAPPAYAPRTPKAPPAFTAETINARSRPSGLPPKPPNSVYPQPYQ